MGTHRYYRPELDVLRFVAFVLVFLSHVVPGDEAFFTQLHFPRQVGNFIIALAAGGSWGVDLFFALSSYLISTILLREAREFGGIDVQSFYMRRVLRIWPLYYVFLLGVFLLGVVPLARGWFPADSMSGPYALTFALFVGNWASALWGYSHSIAGHLWSVSIEEQFYLTWPLLLRRWADHLVAVACALLVIAFVTRGWLVAGGAIHPQIWCNTLARLDPIACGALLAVWTQRRALAPSAGGQLTPTADNPLPPSTGELSARDGEPALASDGQPESPSADPLTHSADGQPARPSDSPLRQLTVCRLALFAGGLLGFAAIGQFGDFTGRRAMLTYPAGTLASMALLVGILGAPLSAGNALVAASTYLGRISYGLYVFHLMFIYAFGVTDDHEPLTRLLRTTAALLATIAAAACSHRFLEQPFLRLKRSRFTRLTTAPCARG